MIGTIEGKCFDIIYANNYGLSLYDVFDQEDADTSSLIPYLLDNNGDIKDEYYSIYSNVYYLDRIEIQDKYKGKGYAKFLLNNLEEILMYVAKINFGIIIIQAQPFDRVNGQCIMDYKDKKRMERLVKLYEDAGFKRIGKSNYLISINE